MRTTLFCWPKIVFLGVFMALATNCGDSTPTPVVAGTQRSPELPSDTVVKTNPAPSTSGELDLETARKALIAAIENSKEPSFRTRLEDLSLTPVKGPSTPESSENVYWYFGNRTVIRVYDKTWSMEVSLPGEGAWEIFGEFRRNSNNAWEAVETSRHGRGNRGGI
jgi:hypothetical protein